jgi:hypothetical protein
LNEYLSAQIGVLDRVVSASRGITDDDLKPHVQQRGTGAIFRIEVLGLSIGPGNASANCGNDQEECPWRP